MKSFEECCSVKSMTGFARVGGVCGAVGIEVEIRSVNHRFFECSLRGPRGLGPVERDLRGILQKEHRRGRFDVVVYRREQTANRQVVTSAPEHYGPIISAYAATCKQFGVGLESVAAFIGQLVLRDISSTTELGEVPASELSDVIELVRRCSEMLLEARRAEGAALVVDIQHRLALVESMRHEISDRMAGGAQRLRERMTERLATLAPDIRVDADRLALEIALMADRIDVSEELSRLSIHLTQFRLLLKQGHAEGVGRRLDFLLQEIGRELNTIGSKAQDAGAQGYVVEAKAEIEKIREQIQNIE